ncbi:MAG: hypothetical protein ACOCTT_04090 [archaeon]
MYQTIRVDENFRIILHEDGYKLLTLKNFTVSDSEISSEEGNVDIFLHIRGKLKDFSITNFKDEDSIPEEIWKTIKEIELEKV